ncbi:hypothetical protein evm_015490, partial [Chilo suppressalis]
MENLRVNKCCYCIGLRTGSLIIAYIYLIDSFCTIASSWSYRNMLADNYEVEQNNKMGAIALFVCLSVAILILIIIFILSIVALIGMHR